MVERDDRSAVATFFTATTPSTETVVALSDAAAHHARVKRLAVGDTVRLTNGCGLIASGELAALSKNAADVHIRRVDTVAREFPIHLRVPIGDRDRMLWLAEKGTELGIATWQGIRFRRSISVSPRGEGAAFGEKVRARMIAALEQSAGAWLPEQIVDAALDDIDVPPTAVRLLLDMDGTPLRHETMPPSATPPVVLFGPEGGLDSAERDALITAGWKPVRLATNTLRFETAGVAAIAVIRSAQMRLPA